MNYKDLMSAISNRDTCMVQQVLDAGVSPNDHLKGGQSALINSADEGDIEVFRLLLNKGADINYQDDAGDTALICASVANYDGIVIECIKYGAEINFVNRFGSTAIGYAVHHDSKRVVNILEQLKAINC